MKSSTTPSFWRAYSKLSPAIQNEARKAYQLWKANPLIHRFTSNAKVIIGPLGSRAGGGRWRESTKVLSIGFGLGRTTSIKGDSKREDQTNLRGVRVIFSVLSPRWMVSL